jgi:hypothetical protein
MDYAVTRPEKVHMGANLYSILIECIFDNLLKREKKLFRRRYDAKSINMSRGVGDRDVQ